MRYLAALIAPLFLAAPLFAEAPKPNTLTPQEIADGWILLFDGETTFGWQTEADVKVENNELKLGGDKKCKITTTSQFGDFELKLEYLAKGDNGLGIGFNDHFTAYSSQRDVNVWIPLTFTVKATEAQNEKVTEIRVTMMRRGRPVSQTNRLLGQDGIQIGFSAAEGSEFHVRNLKLKPLNLDPLFNGKDLAGWTRFTADEKRAKSKFTVTPEGWLNVQNGPGDLQTEKQFRDFVFQGECISNGKHLNSGIFFRCQPGKYQQGYEMQIRNEWTGDDRTKPVDYGTGAIYRRQPARKVVSSDVQWFGMTIAAHGRHIATWINGYQTVDWTDPRPENENARNGARLGAGPISIQGHDPTTNLSFRNLRAAELKKN